MSILAEDAGADAAACRTRAAPARATAGRRWRCCGSPRGPTSAHVAWATLWLAVAGLLEALGPIFGKRLIDDYLLPRHADCRDDGRCSAPATS